MPKFFSFIFIIAAGFFFLAFGVSLRSESNFQKEEDYNKIAQSCLQFEGGAEMQCLNDLVKRIAETEGIRPALRIIEPVVSQHSYMLRWTHPFAHTIGKNGYFYYKNQAISLHDFFRDDFAGGEITFSQGL